MSADRASGGAGGVASAGGRGEPGAREFFVGYLAMPRGLARFVSWVAPGLVAAGLAIAWFVSGTQSDPGAGVWHEQRESLVGRVSLTPYALLRVATTQPGRAFETVLLVSEGKHGAGERVAAHDGRVVQARGTILERDGRRLLELADAEEVTPADAAAEASAPRLAASSAARQRVTLRGEIIDPKCYAGAMKPGEGKTHKECATLCIAGGIPPMFVAWDAQGTASWYLLCDADGRGLVGARLERVLPFVADWVELSGELETLGDVQVLRIDAESVRRL